MSDPFLSGAISMGFLVISLFFARFWKTTQDRLFLFFSAAILLLTLERIIREVWNVQVEWATALYLFRLCAFVLILIAIIDKNRRA
jgi:hypothetical protein